MGAGKSTVAALFRRRGVPVFDADRVVHRLQGRGGRAVSAIAALGAGLVEREVVRRDRLRVYAAADPAHVRRLEGILHPLVEEERERFLRRARARGVAWCVLDIPLLFEVGADRMCDLVVVASAPEAVRRRRIMARRKLTEAQAGALLARQMPDVERRRRADVVVWTGLSRGFAARQVAGLWARMMRAP